MKKNYSFHGTNFAKMKKKFFQTNIEKNGPIVGAEMESCLRQCTVCPDATFSEYVQQSLEMET